MSKAPKVLGIINIILTAFLVVFFVGLLGELANSNGWVNLLFISLSLTGMGISLILTIPLVVYLIKYKLPAIKFYFYTHVGLFAFSIIIFLVGFIVR